MALNNQLNKLGYRYMFYTIVKDEALKTTYLLVHEHNTLPLL